LRIIGGANKGQNIITPENGKIRPTSNRVREAIFNILDARLDFGFSGLTVIDLFSGSGAFAFEALSRGAAQAISVDKDQSSIDLLRSNMTILNADKILTILKCDALNLPKPPAGLNQASIAFIDPPYHLSLVEPALSSLVLNQWLLGGALCVIEASIKDKVGWPINFCKLDSKQYGKTKIYLLQFEE
tara:strand:+ start:9359 stop:9919 length:561 start_codon:yes stop_codon:yes gene_type:complete